MSEKQKEKFWKILNTVSELSLCIVVISGIFIYHQMANKIVEMQETIDKQSQQIQELASFNRYSLASHKRIKEAEEITESSTAFPLTILLNCSFSYELNFGLFSNSL